MSLLHISFTISCVGWCLGSKLYQLKTCSGNSRRQNNQILTLVPVNNRGSTKNLVFNIGSGVITSFKRYKIIPKHPKCWKYRSLQRVSQRAFYLTHLPFPFLLGFPSLNQHWKELFCLFHSQPNKDEDGSVIKNETAIPIHNILLYIRSYEEVRKQISSGRALTIALCRHKIKTSKGWNNFFKSIISECLNRILNNKIGPFFLKFNWCKDKLA